jgi:hypothetical protein
MISIGIFDIEPFISNKGTKDAKPLAGFLLLAA